MQRTQDIHDIVSALISKIRIPQKLQLFPQSEATLVNSHYP